MPSSHRRLALLAFGAACLAPLPAFAQTQPADPSTALIDVTQLPTFDDLERAIALANQSVFNALQAQCADGAGPGCTEAQLAVLGEVQELVDTALEIADGQPRQNSLGLGPEGLAEVLRWTAAEENSAKSRVATDFANGQVANATHRITALRFGATGFSVAGFPGLPVSDLPDVAEGAALGPAGADAGDGLARWGGFLNGAYGFGEHDPTTFEDAFDYDSYEVTAGVDYRFLPNLVGGLVGGYSNNEIDFDGSRSIVDGGIDSDGFSVGSFGLYSWNDVYVSGFFSYQRMDYEIDRFIRYTSLNPMVPSTDTRTKGDTESDAFTVTANAGYTWRFGLDRATGFFSGKPFLLEPSVRAEYTDVTIDGYTERNVDASGFALRIGEQDFESLEVALGLRGSVAVSTPVGVFFPYARGEWRFELDDDTRTTSSQYAGAAGAGGLVPFRLSSEDVDESYGVVVAGIQTVLLGGRQRQLGGLVGGRLSVFAEYRTVFELDDIETRLINGGVRYSF